MATLTFDKRIYKKSAVVNTAKAYIEYATFKITDHGKETRVEISEIDPETGENFEKEFCNYVIYKSRMQ